MIVIAIIAILAAILIPNFLHARAESQTVGCEDNLRAIATALEEYAVDNSGTYPASGAVTNSSIGATYLAITPRDPINTGGGYSMTNTAGSYGAFLISDSGGHDTSTTGSL